MRRRGRSRGRAGAVVALLLVPLLAAACAGGDGDGGGGVGGAGGGGAGADGGTTAPAPTAAGAPAPVAGFGQAEVRVTRDGETVGGGCALVADEPEARRQGLMGRRDLGGHVGMVFVFDEAVTGRFWMRNTPMPLSIAFFDADGAYVSDADMAPCGDRDDCPRYAAADAYRYALEVPRGRLDDLGVGPGTELELAGACG